MPASLVVLGGGAVGAELAQVFARFGSQVTVAEGAGHLLPLEEPEAGGLPAEVFGADGIGVRTGQPAAGVAYSALDGFTVALRGAGNCPARRCWWPPAAASTSPRWGRGRWASTRACAPFRSMSTTGRLIAWAGQPVGALLGGLLAEHMPIRPVFGLMTVGVAIGAALAGWSCLRSRPLSRVSISVQSN